MTHTSHAPVALSQRITRCMLNLAIMTMVVSCESTKTLMPALRAPEDIGLAVRFQAATTGNAAPLLVLIDIPSGEVLASTESRFTPEVVQAVGAPAGIRLIVHASLTGDTVAAWENASESPPDEQIVLFKRDHHPDGSVSWHARNLFPPSRHAKPYPIYGKPATVDDEHLYFTIENGPGEKVKWAALKPVPPGYKPKPVKVEEDGTKKGEPKNENPERSDEAKSEQAPM